MVQQGRVKSLLNFMVPSKSYKSYFDLRRFPSEYNERLI